jgi:4-hydroxy-3-polyprenylbenzoate decarboxylase
MSGDLRDFIALLERHGELARVQTPVSADLEISEIYFRHARSPGGGKALLFENVIGSKLPVLINAFGSHRRVELALNRGRISNRPGMLDEICSELRSLMKLLELRPPGSASEIMDLASKASRVLRYPPKRMRFGRPPCQEIVLKGQDADLSILPVLKSWPLDAGAFITLGMVLTTSLDRRKRNLGLYRMQVLDRHTTAMHWQIHKDGSHFYSQYRHAGKRMPVAVVFGGDPAIAFSGIAPMPPGLFELLMAGFIRGKGVKMAKCVTQDLEVPADAEIVIEGYVDPEDFVPEGPFGDHTGYYTPVEPFPRFHVTAMTMRKGAIYPATVVGRSPQEDCYLARAVERIFLPMLQFIAPEVKDQMLPWDGCFHNGAVLSIEKHFPFQARKLMNHLWGFSQMSFSKSLIVVDSSVNLQGPERELLDTVLDRLELSSDVLVTEGVLDQLDHSGIRPLFGGKIGLDVTTKTPEERTVVPGSTAYPDAGPQQVVPHWIESLKAEGITVAHWHTYGMNLKNRVLLLSIDKGKTGRAAARTASILGLAAAESPFTILLLLDAKDDPRRGSLVLWKLFGNTDALRDLTMVENPGVPGGRIAVVDATSKNEADGYTRTWPEENLMDEKTIRLVDSKWKEMFGQEPFEVERP